MTYHHYVGTGLNRVERIEALVVNHILNSKLDNEKRESSIQWELKHSSGVIQLAKMLAQKRGVNGELAVVAAALHDIYVILNGSYEEHAKKSSEIAKQILIESKQFSNNEITKICKAVAEHSNKQKYSDNKLIELIKDADCLDCFLYTKNGYDSEKPKEILVHYYNRIVKIRKELGLPEDEYLCKRFETLQKECE